MTVQTSTNEAPHAKEQPVAPQAGAFQTRHVVEKQLTTRSKEEPDADRIDRLDEDPPATLAQSVARSLAQSALHKDLWSEPTAKEVNERLESSVSSQRQLTLKVVNRNANANAVVPEISRDDFVGQLRNHNALARLGAQHITDLVGKDALPTENTAPSIFWRDENDNTPREFEVADLRSMIHEAKSVCFQIQVPRILWRSHIERLNAYLFEMSLQHFGAALQTAAITGTGANGQPLGLLATAAAEGSQIQSEDLSGGITTPKLLSMLEKLADVESSMLSTEVGFVVNPKTLKALRDLTTAGGNDAIEALGLPPRLHLLGYPIETIKAVPDGVVILADWANGLEFLHWPPALDLLVDPFTQSQRVKVLASGFVNLAVKREPFFVIGQ